MPRQMTLIALIRELESMREYFPDDSLMSVEVDGKIEPVLSVLSADDRITGPAARGHLVLLIRPESWMVATDDATGS